MSPAWCKVSFWRSYEQPEIQIAHRSFKRPNNLYFCWVRGQKQTSCWLSAHNQFLKHLRVAFYTFHTISFHYFKMRPEQLYSQKYLAILFIQRLFFWWPFWSWSTQTQNSHFFSQHRSNRKLLRGRRNVGFPSPIN